MVWLWCLLSAFVGFMLGVLCVYGAMHEKRTGIKPVSLTVTTKKDKENWHADKYCLDGDVPSLHLVCSGRKSKWVPIWEIENGLLVMTVVDPEYIKNNGGSVARTFMPLNLTKK